tara:strand:- start:990 stop:1934 length:945 start_codon:yes stop_codon:yes gene_type:complete
MNIPTVKERIDFYKGHLLRENNTFNLKKYNIGNTNINYNNLNIKFYKDCNDLNYGNKNEKLYTKPILYLLSNLNYHNKPFLLSVGDLWQPKIHKPIELPVLTKNRFTDNEKDCSIILRSLNYKRHWELYYNRPRDMPFEYKKDVLYWRGVSTGSPEKPANRFKLLEKWFNRRNYIDIGFTEIVQGKYKWGTYLAGRKVWPSEFLYNKYLLSVEGNDKDSGLNWKLNSNSLVLMAKPRCQSWLMESKLIPGFHYVLLKDDFSDLDEKILWCNSNQEACKFIIKNANDYMRQFSNPSIEYLIEKEVINSYFNNLKI